MILISKAWKCLPEVCQQHFEEMLPFCISKGKKISNANCLFLRILVSDASVVGDYKHQECSLSFQVTMDQKGHWFWQNYLTEHCKNLLIQIKSASGPEACFQLQLVRCFLKVTKATALPFSFPKQGIKKYNCFWTWRFHLDTKSNSLWEIYPPGIHLISL